VCLILTTEESGKGNENDEHKEGESDEEHQAHRRRAPSELPALCDEHADEASLYMCRELCEPEECCWRTGVKECSPQSSEGEGALICESYAPCKLLHRSPPNLPLEIKEWCFGGSAEDRDLCKDACQRGNCCIGTADGDGETGLCFNHMYVCKDYFACALVNPAFGEMDLDGDGIPDLEINSDSGNDISLVIAPRALAQDCNFLYFDSNGKDKCETACAKAACCIDDSDVKGSNCFREDEIVCLGYFPCNSIDLKFATMLSEPPYQYAPPTQLLISEEDSSSSSLSDNCENASTDDAARLKCEETCGGGACCVQQEQGVLSNYNCYDKFEDDCQGYAACASVFSQFENMSVPPHLGLM
jgi:hypothetical protein